jgi:hypothetical protein
MNGNNQSSVPDWPALHPEPVPEPTFTVSREDASTITIRGASLPDALRRYYDHGPASESPVIAIVRVDPFAAIPDRTFVFGLDVRELSDIVPGLAAYLIEHDIVPHVSVDPDGSDWALRVGVAELPHDAPDALRSIVANEYDGNWNLSHGSLDQMNEIAREWTARQEALHAGLVVTGP